MTKVLITGRKSYDPGHRTEVEIQVDVAPELAAEHPKVRGYRSILEKRGYDKVEITTEVTK